MSLSLRDAWLVLGREPWRVARAVKAAADRVLGAEEELLRAKSLARRLLGLHHPDRNPGDPSAEERFALVKEALAVVEAGTEDLRSQEARRAECRDGAVFIEVDGG